MCYCPNGALLVNNIVIILFWLYMQIKELRKLLVNGEDLLACPNGRLFLIKSK